jgi:hypothetical protein
LGTSIVGGGCYLVKNYGLDLLKELGKVTAQADDDILLDESVLPEFSIDLSEAPDHIK